FTDADFIFAQMRVGLYHMRELDEKIPLKYGVVGQETCGPGGLAYGLRTIYPMVEVIDYCEKYASKDYWIVNYSNPAAIVAKAMHKLRPNARILNICDMPVAIMRNMANILNCDRKDIVPDYFGLNHFGWFTKIRVGEEDRTEELKAYVREHGYMPPDDRSEVRHNDASWKHTFDNAKNLMRMFPDYLPNTYMQYYLLGDEIVKHSDQNYTRANEVMDGREKRIFQAAEQYESTGEIDMTPFFTGVHGEFIVEVAMSLAFNLKKRHLVMVMNNGAVKNLPDDAMVEIPCYITNEGPEATRVGEIPTFFKGMIEQQEACEKLIVEAAIEGSYDKALAAFTLNKTIPSAMAAKQILDEMIEANKDYWPELN
ncbi:MAG TPA: 6-phospho-alpha-glucosidase, partial [Lachnoclostridium sp.]|nr:6-phospho-alpha-glucosidase [Lachnoclostridium sp.]